MDLVLEEQLLAEADYIESVLAKDNMNRSDRFNREDEARLAHIERQLIWS